MAQQTTYTNIKRYAAKAFNVTKEYTTAFLHFTWCVSSVLTGHTKQAESDSSVVRNSKTVEQISSDLKAVNQYVYQNYGGYRGLARTIGRYLGKAYKTTEQFIAQQLYPFLRSRVEALLEDFKRSDEAALAPTTPADPAEIHQKVCIHEQALAYNGAPIQKPEPTTPPVEEAPTEEDARTALEEVLGPKKSDSLSLMELQDERQQTVEKVKDTARYYGGKVTNKINTALGKSSVTELQNALMAFREKAKKDLERLEAEKGTGVYNKLVSSELRYCFTNAAKPFELPPVDGENDVQAHCAYRVGYDGFGDLEPLGDDETLYDSMGLTRQERDYLQVKFPSISNEALQTLDLGAPGKNRKKFKQNLEIATDQNKELIDNIAGVLDQRDAAWKSETVDDFLYRLGLNEPLNVYYDQLKQNLRSMLELDSAFKHNLPEYIRRDPEAVEVYNFLFSQFRKLCEGNELLPARVERVRSKLDEQLRASKLSGLEKGMIKNALALTPEIILNKMKNYQELMNQNSYSQHLKWGLDCFENLEVARSIKGFVHDLNVLERSQRRAEMQNKLGSLKSYRGFTDLWCEYVEWAMSKEQ